MDFAGEMNDWTLPGVPPLPTFCAAPPDMKRALFLLLNRFPLPGTQPAPAFSPLTAALDLPQHRLPFSGGGTSTAAFQWGFGTLPIDIHASEFLARARLVMAEHASLIVLAVLFSVALVLSIVYIRCVFRFILVDAVIKQDVSVREAWKRMEPAGRTYFLWLLALVGVMLVFVCAAAIGSFRYLNFIREAGDPEWFFSVVLVMELVAVVGWGAGGHRHHRHR